jgi:hypothetical protein
LRPPGKMPPVAQPRRTHSCITRHRSSSPDLVSASGRQAGARTRRADPYLEQIEDADRH